MKKRVLIYEPGLSQAVAVAKQFKQYGHFHITGCWNKLTFARKWLFQKNWFDALIEEPYARDEHRQKYDVIVPTGAESTKELAEKFGDFTLGSQEFHKENLRVYDKLWMIKKADALNIPIPKTYPKKEDIQSYPVFYKSLFEHREGENIKGIARREMDLYGVDINKVLFQEYIPSLSTYGVGFLADSGNLRTSFTHLEFYSYPKQGGSGVIMKHFESPVLKAYIKKMVKALNYTGWGLAEFKYDSRDKKYKFMEINAKLWASIEFVFLNNPNFVKKLLDIDKPAQFCEQVIFLDRFFGSSFYYALKHLKYLFSSYYLNTDLRNIAYIHLSSIVPQRIKQLFKEK